MNRNFKIFIPATVFLLISLVYTVPLLKNIGNYGEMDWDQLTFWSAVPRETILRYHQFPLWNPYSNGGNVLLASPFTFYLTPFFIPVLAFGPVVGLKIQWCLSLFLGMCGMFCVCRHFRMKTVSQYLAPVIVMLSSTFTLHLTEGHPWTGIALLPWYFLFTLKAGSSRKYLLLAALMLALMVLSSTVYIYVIFPMFVYSLLLSIKERSGKHLLSLGLTFVFGFLICAVKLIPVFIFLKENPRTIESAEEVDLPLFSRMLLSRDQGPFYEETKWLVSDKKIPFKGRALDYGWHEYGAYIGFVALGLALIGSIFYFKQHWDLLGTALVLLWLSLGRGAFYNLWGLLHKLPVYDTVHVPSRFMFVFVFCISLFAGLGLSRLEALSDAKYYKLFMGFIVLFVFADLFSVDYPLLIKAFTVKPPEIQRHAEFQQRYRDLDLFPMKTRSSMYPAFLSNSGVINGYDVVSVEKGAVKTVGDGDYRGEVYLLQDHGFVHTIDWTPNRIEVEVNIRQPDTLIINQNFYSGWRVSGIKENVNPHEGLISVKVPAGSHKVAFYYLPNSFIIGCVVTVLTFLAALVVLVSKQKNI